MQLSWDASTDNVGVTGYDIYRDGTLLASLAPPAGYLDQSVQPGTTYSYYVVAKDAAGNASPPSNTAPVTTPTDSTMFFDGFESGDMSAWTTATGMTCRSSSSTTASYAAEAVASGAPAYAYEQLARPWPALYYATRFYVGAEIEFGYLLRFRTGQGRDHGPLLSSTGKLGFAQRCHVHHHDQFHGRLLRRVAHVELYGRQRPSGQARCGWTAPRSRRSLGRSRLARPPSAICSSATRRQTPSTSSSTTSTPTRCS